MDQHEDEPPLNAAVGDLLARCSTPDDCRQALTAWLLLGAEHLARECGRSACLGALGGVADWIREASPSTPWKP